ncbi:MAG: hypothetical protein IJ566_04530 [Cardiobacteriaceae bacterium]|nr:hypothetical protein [Cardiobacteriaceae bacterium]
MRNLAQQNNRHCKPPTARRGNFLTAAVILSRRQKIYRQILRFAQDDGSIVWQFYRQPLAKNLAAAVILSRKRKIYRRSFAALRMTAAVFGFYRHFERSEKSCRNLLDNFFFLIIIPNALFIERIFYSRKGKIYAKKLDFFHKMWYNFSARAQERKSARAKLKLKQMRFFRLIVEEKNSYSSKFLNHLFY